MALPRQCPLCAAVAIDNRRLLGRALKCRPESRAAHGRRFSWLQRHGRREAHWGASA
eukprot:CAMPEP_0171274826 /NCGR_PEP_ID=MMETSP0790-20130122/63008_1 /TAXON_ID=2925 /ORGANISM="Alexandrium catenella, Strain OF101" /LENGTH=56 /DNA_ID=CAMNT_0011743873 /DNA_START=1 /DNA_END=168 /DNA_ORIENTATION=+